MFASSSKGAYICRRCQFKALEKLPLPSRNAAQAQTIGARRTTATHASRAQDSKRARTIYPHGKLRGRVGGEVRELTERLPQDALGKPAEIIVLKDAGLDRTGSKRRGSQKREVAEPEKPSQNTILSSLNEPESPADSETGVTAALAELRSKALESAELSYGVLSREVCDSISKEVHDGFTQKQLHSYLVGLLKEGKRGQRDERHETTIGSPVRSAWTAGTVDAKKLHGVRQLQRILYQPKKRSKVVLTSLIMDAWGIRSGMADQIGEIQLQNVDDIFGVNDEHGSSIVAQISTRHQVSIKRTSNGAQVRGERESSEQAADEILRQLTHEIFKLEMKLWNPRLKKGQGPAHAGDTGRPSKDESPTQDEIGEGSKTTIEAGYLSSEAAREVNQKDLEMISTMTGAEIKFDALKTRLKITGRSPTQVADAERALFTISDLPTRSSSISRIPPENRKVLHDVNLPYNASGGVFSRAACDVRLDPDHGQHPSGALGKTLRESHCQADRILESATTLNLLDPKHKSHWSLEQQARLSARLGQIYVRPHSHRALERRGRGGLEQGEGKWSPCLVHVPALISYLGLDNAEAPAPTRNIVSFAFRHDICAAGAKDQDRITVQYEKGTRPLPEIRVDFELGQAAGERPTLLSMHAIVEDAAMLIAYPNRPLDLSLSYLQTCPFHHAAHAPAGQAIREMSRSIASDARLRAPSLLDLPVPATWTGRYPGLPALATAEADGEAPFRMARYRFVGVEHRQLISFRWGARELQVASVEAGRFGASSLELKSVRAVESLQATEGLRSPFGERQREQVRRGIRALYGEALQTGEQLLDLVDRAARGALRRGERSLWAERPEYRGGRRGADADAEGAVVGVGVGDGEGERDGSGGEQGLDLGTGPRGGRSRTSGAAD